jgi:hypothetical protein
VILCRGALDWVASSSLRGLRSEADGREDPNSPERDARSSSSELQRAPLPTHTHTHTLTHSLVYLAGGSGWSPCIAFRQRGDVQPSAASARSGPRRGRRRRGRSGLLLEGSSFRGRESPPSPRVGRRRCAPRAAQLRSAPAVRGGTRKKGGADVHSTRGSSRLVCWLSRIPPLAAGPSSNGLPRRKTKGAKRKKVVREKKKNLLCSFCAECVCACREGEPLGLLNT